VNNNATGARYQIVVDGVPRSNRDDKKNAIDAAEYLRKKNQHAKVEVRDILTGETVA
jgi:hypothetical protein